VATSARAVSYTWNIPAGLQVVGSASGNVLRAVATSAFIGGTLGVASTNVCGSSPQRTRLLSQNVPTTPASISGSSTALCNAGIQTYTAALVTGIQNYQWSVPNNASIVSGQGTATVSVNWNNTVGSISVVAVNGCGSSTARSMNVSMVPNRPASVTRNPLTPACINAAVEFNTPTVAGASTYSWTLTGAPVIVGQGSKTITATWATGAAASQFVAVRAGNTCGLSVSRSISVALGNCVRLADNALQRMLIYPNPSAGRVTLQLQQPVKGEVIISVRDAGGKLLMQERSFNYDTVQQFTVDVSGLPEGVYIVELLGDDTLVQERLIKLSE